MSKIEEMLKRLCPEGVEQVPLGDLLNYEQPGKYIVESVEYDNSYDTPVLTAGQTFVLGYTNETSGVYRASGDAPVIIFDDFTTANKWVDFDFKVKSSAMKILTLKESDAVSLRYVYFSMQVIKYVPVEHTRQWIEKYSKFEIPLPPRPVQDEIVKALDAMGAAVKALEEERAARQEQFEAERERIFSAANDADGVLLSDVIENVSSRGHQINQSEIQKDGAFPVVSQSANDVEGYTDKDICVETLPVIVFGDHTCWLKFVDFPFVVGADGTKLLVPKDERTLGVKYLYYALTSIISKVFDGKYRRHYSILLERRIPIPIVSVQKKIAAQLDAFAAVVAALDEEIAARREQFAGWLEKLMMFDVKEVA